MGGNTKAINRETGEVVNFFGRPGYAESVNLQDIDRSLLKNNVLTMLKILDGLYKRDYGFPIWDPQERDSILSSGQAFNGSSEHLFNDNISDKEFIKHKPSVGDIDLTVPSEKIETLFELLGTLEGSEIVPGKMWYIGQNRQKFMGDQINALFAYRQQKKSDPIFLQVDFEAVDYKSGRPDTFAKFSHSSAWEDVKEGIKGVFHKYLLRSLTTKAILQDAVLLTKTSPLYPPEKVKIKKKTDPIKFLSFSVSSGVRTTVELQRYPSEPGIPKELINEPVKVGDSFAYKELSTAESSYVKNVDEIFTLLFNQLPTNDSDLAKFGSFNGGLSLMKNYMTDEEIENIYENFINEKLFGPEAQRLDLKSAEVDKSAKFAAVGKFRKTFPFLAEPDQTLVQSYYSAYKVRESLRRYLQIILRG